MIKLYGHPGAPKAVKIEVLLEESGAPYVFRVIDLVRGENRQPAFLAINPAGRVPVIDDDGFILAESNAILRYLAARLEMESWYPNDLRSRALVDQWIDQVSFHVNNVVHPLYLNRYLYPLLGMPVDTAALAAAEKAVPGALAVVEARLEATGAFLCGPHPTIADLVLTEFLSEAESFGLDLKPYSNIVRWLGAMTSRPAWERVRDGIRSQRVP
jgi:glutathione S-transferase